MKWIKASERLPGCKNKFYNARTGSLKENEHTPCLIFIDAVGSLRSEEGELVNPDFYEWLDESPSPDNQEEFWLDVKNIFMNHYENYNYPIQAIKELQSKYTISKK